MSLLLALLGGGPTVISGGASVYSQTAISDAASKGNVDAWVAQTVGAPVSVPLAGRLRSSLSVASIEHSLFSVTVYSTLSFAAIRCDMQTTNMIVAFDEDAKTFTDHFTLDDGTDQPISGATVYLLCPLLNGGMKQATITNASQGRVSITLDGTDFTSTVQNAPTQEHSGEAQWRIVFSNSTKRAVPEDAKRFRLIVKPWVV